MATNFSYEVTPTQGKVEQVKIIPQHSYNHYFPDDLRLAMYDSQQLQPYLAKLHQTEGKVVSLENLLPEWDEVSEWTFKVPDKDIAVYCSVQSISERGFLHASIGQLKKGKLIEVPEQEMGWMDNMHLMKGHLDYFSLRGGRLARVTYQPLIPNREFETTYQAKYPNGRRGSGSSMG
jgi:hypothetical protein